MRFLVAPLVAVAALASLAGVGGACTSAGPAAPAAALPVVASVTQVSALVRSVGGDRIRLTALVGPGDDPHAHDIRPSEVRALSGAAVSFESGAGLDGWLERGARAAGRADRLVDLSTAVHLRRVAGGGADPHWWYDVGNAKAAARAIATALSRADPASARHYRDAADSLDRRFDAADAQVRAAIDPIPPARRLFVANHDAFNYFLARYGITLVGDVVPSTDSIAAVRPAETAKLVQEIRARHVCAIFTETTIDAKLAQQVATEAGVRVYAGRLYGDAIGGQGSPGETLEGALVYDGRLMAEAMAAC